MRRQFGFLLTFVVVGCGAQAEQQSLLVNVSSVIVSVVATSPLPKQMSIENITETVELMVQREGLKVATAGSTFDYATRVVLSVSYACSNFEQFSACSLKVDAIESLLIFKAGIELETKGKPDIK